METFIESGSFFFLVLIAFILTLIFLTYKLPKLIGKKWTKITIWSIFGSTILFFVVITVFEEKFYTKSDAKEDLLRHQIVLSDNFELISYEASGIRRYYRKLKLKISQEDHQKLINRISSAQNYIDNESDHLINLKDLLQNPSDTFSFTTNYQNEWCYVYEYYKQNRKGYSPTWQVISIVKTENILIFENMY